MTEAERLAKLLDSTAESNSDLYADERRFIVESAAELRRLAGKDEFPIRLEYLPHRMVYAVIRKSDSRELWHCDHDAFYHSGMNEVKGTT